MWCYTKVGFYSVVENTADADTVLVRARCREDIQALRPYLLEQPDTEYTPDRDYTHRIVVTKATWAAAIMTLAVGIDYPNFKSAIPNKKRHNVYMRVWDVTREGFEFTPLMQLARLKKRRRKASRKVVDTSRDVS